MIGKCKQCFRLRVTIDSEKYKKFKRINRILEWNPSYIIIAYLSRMRHPWCSQEPALNIPITFKEGIALTPKFIIYINFFHSNHAPVAKFCLASGNGHFVILFFFADACRHRRQRIQPASIHHELKIAHGDCVKKQISKLCVTTGRLVDIIS